MNNRSQGEGSKNRRYLKRSERNERRNRFKNAFPQSSPPKKPSVPYLKSDTDFPPLVPVEPLNLAKQKDREDIAELLRHFSHAVVNVGVSIAPMRIPNGTFAQNQRKKEQADKKTDSPEKKTEISRKKGKHSEKKRIYWAKRKERARNRKEQPENQNEQPQRRREELHKNWRNDSNQSRGHRQQQLYSPSMNSVQPVVKRERNCQPPTKSQPGYSFKDIPTSLVYEVSDLKQRQNFRGSSTQQRRPPLLPTPPMPSRYEYKLPPTPSMSLKNIPSSFFYGLDTIPEKKEVKSVRQRLVIDDYEDEKGEANELEREGSEGSPVRKTPFVKGSKRYSFRRAQRRGTFEWPPSLTPPVPLSQPLVRNDLTKSATPRNRYETLEEQLREKGIAYFGPEPAHRSLWQPKDEKIRHWLLEDSDEDDI